MIKEFVMVSVTVQIDEDFHAVLQEIANMKGISIEEALQTMLVEDLQRIKRRMNDPIIGALDPFVKGKGVTDVSSHADDIIASEWEPD
jgi:hypothetical protein